MNWYNQGYTIDGSVKEDCGVTPVSMPAPGISENLLAPMAIGLIEKDMCDSDSRAAYILSTNEY